MEEGSRPIMSHVQHFLQQICVRNSREHQRSLCITWLDFKNAFGSVSHDLMIDFTMEWYHWAESVLERLFMHIIVGSCM